MKHRHLITVAGLTASLMSISGCAGKSLKDIFARNETAGYSTLDEIEKRESESRVAADETSGPRFAPWLKRKPEAAAVADTTDTTPTAVADAETPGAEPRDSFWKRPFRKPGESTVVDDPFVDPKEQSVPRTTETKSVAHSKPRQPSAEDNAREDSTRTVSHSGTATKRSAATEDEAVVNRFEEHFRKNTEQAAKGADDLIVAGQRETSKTASAASQAAKRRTGAEAEKQEKLAELEELLESRKNRPSQVTRAGGKDSAEETIRQLAGVVEEEAAEKGAKPSSRFPIETLRRESRSSEEAPFEKLVAQSSEGTKQTARNAADRAARRTRTESHAAQESAKRKASSLADRSGEVAVADADALFGAAARRVQQAMPANTAASTAPASNDSANAFRWKSGAMERTRSFAQETARMGADSLAGVLTQPAAEPVPAAVAPADPDDVQRFAEPGTERSSFRMVSDSEEEGQAIPQTPLATPDGLTADNFFTVPKLSEPDAPKSAGQPVANEPATSESSETEFEAFEATLTSEADAREEATSAPSGSLMSRITARSWVLLIGGIIAIILLFAPNRKKAMSAT